jgi:hypothetical protein
MTTKRKVVVYIVGAIAVVGISAAALLGTWEWNQFIPDLIVSLTSSIVVGIGVGYALWRFQDKAEDAAAKRAAEADWRMSRPLVVAATREVLDPFANPTSIVLAAGQFDSVLEVGRAMPVGRWADASPNNEEIAALSELLIEGTVYQSLATDLHAEIAAEIKRSRLLHSLEDIQLRVVSALAQNLDPLAYLSAHAERYMEQAGKIAANIEFEIAAYRAQRAIAERAYLRLQILLHVDD